MRDVHWCVTVFYQQIENGNLANQIHGFTIDYGKFILIKNIALRGSSHSVVQFWFKFTKKSISKIKQSSLLWHFLKISKIVYDGF